jgi:DNA/RNA endonuclease G (NUC1)
MAKKNNYPELAKETLLKCKGYDSKFIDGKTNIDYFKTLSKEQKDLLPIVEGVKNGALNYTNLTVCYNKERKGAFFSVYNIDGDKNKLGNRPTFRRDPRIADEIQIDEESFYALGKERVFEVGHLCANNEMCWGTNARTQTLQSFFYTNSIPQTERLNVGLWRSLETYVINQTKSSSKINKISVFTGPIFKSTDPVLEDFNNYKLPVLFFKVIVFEYKTKLYATAFIISHKKRITDLNVKVMKALAGREIEVMPFEDFEYKKVFQVGIDLLIKETGINFKWKNVIPVEVPENKNQIKKILEIDSADDAKAAIKNLRKGVILESLNATNIISNNEIKTNKFYLNMILP